MLRVRGLGLEKKNSRMFSLNFLPGKVCWPVNNEVADNRGRKYTIGLGAGVLRLTRKISGSTHGIRPKIEIGI